MGPETTSTDVMQGVDLTGKFAIVTGGSSGIGFETARALVSAGAAVCIGARDVAKLHRAAGELRNISKAAVYTVALELSELDSIDSFADAVLAMNRPIDLFIANAGIMACPLERNSRGAEMQLATNYVGHAVLVSRLAGVIAQSNLPRVVALTSSGHHFSGIRDDINFDREGYDKWAAYGQSKTACALLARKVHSAMSNLGVTGVAVHPGFIQTELMRYLTKADYVAMQARTDIELPKDRTYKNVEQGAATTLWAATAPALAGNFAYLEDCKVASPAVRRDTLNGVMPWAIDREIAETLWAKAAQLAGRALPLI
jgi:NAD(P)-dependent dehydrogenase (short-subunit alcohol dehydrogenase family)